MHHDAIVIGGSFAGLSAATYIARTRRPVCVIDAGRPRNRFADASHGFFAQDGSAPAAMIATAKAQLSLYANATILPGEATGARKIDGGFEVTLGDGSRMSARRLVLAFGITDILPDLPGLAERWGKTVLHCPYCHGFEHAGGQLGLLHAGPHSIPHAPLFTEWGPTTLYLNGAPLPDGSAMAELERRGIAVEPAAIAALQGAGTALASVLLADGRVRALDALFVAPRARLNSDVASQLGCAIEDGPFGPMIRTDGFKETTVSGVFAAGDIARAPHSVAWAVGDGVTAGTALHRSLVFPAMAA